MKKYFTLPLMLAAILLGVASGVGASFFLPAVQSVMIGAVIALLFVFALPSHFYAKDAVLRKEADALGTLALNAPVTILTNKKSYPARICATKEKITFLFRFKGRVVPLVLRREDGLALAVSEDGFVSITSRSPERGVFFASGAVLHNIAEVLAALKALGYK